MSRRRAGRPSEGRNEADRDQSIGMISRGLKHAIVDRGKAMEKFHEFIAYYNTKARNDPSLIPIEGEFLIKLRDEYQRVYIQRENTFERQIKRFLILNL
jgi:hypothetical protein